MPYNMYVRAGIGLIGRDSELADLDRFLGGSGSAALAIYGQAGVGKTALTSAFADRAVVAGWQVLRATGVEAEKQFTLGGLNQMVFALRDEVEGLPRRERDVLAPVLGADPVTSPSPMPLAMALLSLLGVAAHDRPVLLLVDDVHWLDELSSTVLSAMGRRVSEPRIRIVAAFRSHLGYEFSTAGWAELVVGPLDPQESARIVDRMELPVSAASRAAILDFAAGNPLALEELPHCAHQIDSWSSSLPLTDRLVTVFGSRLQQLETRVRTELLRAALDGTAAKASPEFGSRYTMVDVEAGIAHDLLRRSPLGDIVFRHPLVRAAVIHQATPAERRDAHAYLAQLYDDVLTRRALHLSAATTTPDQAVADLLDQAAQLSIRRGGASTAVDWLRRAAELSTERSRRDKLRAEAAYVASQASRFEDAQQLADNAESDVPSVASVLAAAYLEFYRHGEVIGTHRRIASVLRDGDALEDITVIRLLSLLLAITMYSGDARHWQQTDELMDRLAERVNEQILLYHDAFSDVVRRGHTVRSRLAEHLDGASALEPWDIMRLGVAAYYVDMLADFRTSLTRAFDRESERGAVTNAMTMLHLLLLDQIGSGAWEHAQRSVRIGLELSTMHHNDLFRYQFIAYDGLRAACIGDSESAQRRAAEVTAWAGPRRIGLLLGVAHRISVLTALADGDYPAAYTATLRLGAAGEFQAYSHQSTEGLLDFIEAAVHAGHSEAARAHVLEAQRLRVDQISPRLYAVTAAGQAMTAADPEAGGLFELAITHHGLADFPFEHNRIRLTYGMWLRRQRRTTDARAVLTRAVDGFKSLGARPWENRARNELRAAGAAVKRSAGDTVALTAQERTIAELAAAGQSNKQIAAQLYLSPRTVGAHLYRIFPKLGVTSRAALGQALRDLPND